MKNILASISLKKRIEINKIEKLVAVSFVLFIFISILSYTQVAKAESDSWMNVGSGMYSNVGGNIGIGTATPVTKLDVAGIVRSKNTTNGGANYLLQTWTGDYTFGLATVDNNQLYIGRVNAGGGTHDDLVVGNGIWSKAPSNGSSTFVNVSNDGSTKFGEAVVNGSSTGSGTYYFGTTSGAGNGITKTYIKIDNNTGVMCLGNC